MELPEFFVKARLVATVAGIAILLLLISRETNDILFPTPHKDDYIKVSFQEDKVLFNEQTKAYKEVCKPAERKQFGLRSITGLSFLFAGVIIPTASLGTAFVIAGVLETANTLWDHWNDIEKITRLISLVLALILLGFFLYRWDKKR